MKKHLPILFTVASSLNYGCASNTIEYSVTSSPAGAPVEVNGVYRGKTPENIQLKCTKQWVGTMMTPTGFKSSEPYSVSAYPPDGLSGNKLTKTVQPCDATEYKKETLYFQFNEYSGLSVEDIAKILGAKKNNKEIRIIKDSLNYNDTTRMGSISTKSDIYDRNEVFKIIENICSTKNIALKVGKDELYDGAAYKTHDEQLADGILTIDFQCLY